MGVNQAFDSRLRPRPYGTHPHGDEDGAIGNAVSLIGCQCPDHSHFTELLETQFPIESPRQQISLRSAKDFADKLHVHTNHLNWAILLTTGKTTTEHIAERVTAEAKPLLKHTDWNIADISYSLGFEKSANFTHFFKKQTSITPEAFGR